MAYQIQLRRDTAADWTSIDPILAQGELGLETDTDFLKVGNGIDAWTALPYLVNSLGGVISLNTLVGALAITSPDGSIVINPTGTDIELTVVNNPIAIWALYR